MEYDSTLLCKNKIQHIFLLKLLHFSYAKEVLNICQHLDFDRISKFFNTVVSTLDIPLHSIHKFKEAFNWDWWKENTEEKYNTMNEI